MKLDDYLTVTDAATMLQVSRQRVLRLIEQKKLRASMVGHSWLIRKVDVLGRLEARSAGKL